MGAIDHRSTERAHQNTPVAIRRALAPVAVLVVVAALGPACAAPTVPPTPTPAPTPSPTPEPKTLTVCLPGEPPSLYLYGTEGPAARHVWQAIYDGPLDSRSFGTQPVILAGLPSLDKNTAAVETVTVKTGDRVLTAGGQVAELALGVIVRDGEGRRVPFGGAPLPMQRMVVTFTLQAGVTWSDGVPVTADDSIYSFELAADPATPTDKVAVERTAGYRAADARTVVWTGVPGFLDHSYTHNFWHPLPRHAWGDLPAAELLSAGVATRQPLGWGPFVLRKWAPGDHVTVSRNPLYFRAPEGLPRLDEVTFRFIADLAVMAAEVVAGRCDVVTHEAAGAVRALLLDPPPLEVRATHDARWELLAFGISPAADYDRPDYFEDIRVRQAVALCIDREAIAQQVLGSAGRVAHSSLPPEHPLYAGDALTTWGYAPEEGQTLLGSAGWYDEDGDGVREAHGIPGIADGTPFQVTYHTTDDPLRVQTAQFVQTYLSQCGVQVSVQPLPAGTLFAPGPEGALFGRRFDLAQFAWRAQPDPLCDLFMSSQIPGPGGWDRPNVTGFLDDRYDGACLSALEAPPGGDAYAAGQIEAQRILSERLPVLPLFQHLKITLAHPSVVGLSPDPTQASELYNIEQLDLLPPPDS